MKHDPDRPFAAVGRGTKHYRYFVQQWLRSLRVRDRMEQKHARSQRLVEDLHVFGKKSVEHVARDNYDPYGFWDGLN